MKNKRGILAVILCIAGFGLMLYPNLQMVLSRFNETVAVSQYEEGALRYNAEEKAEEFRKAELSCRTTTKRYWMWTWG